MLSILTWCDLFSIYVSLFFVILLFILVWCGNAKRFLLDSIQLWVSWNERSLETNSRLISENGWHHTSDVLAIFSLQLPTAHIVLSSLQSLHSVIELALTKIDTWFRIACHTQIYYFHFCSASSLLTSYLVRYHFVKFDIILFSLFSILISKPNHTNYLDLLQISLLPRRQLFLNRNIRKFKLKNVLTKSEMPTVTASSVTETASASIQEKSKITSDDSSIVVQSTVEATSTTTNETTTSTKADALVTTTATTTQSTTTSNTSTTVSTKSKPEIEIIDITLSSNASTLPAGTSVHPASRPLERAGSGCNDGYFIDDRSEININFQKYRMVFVVNKDAVFYKKNAFRQAKLVSSKKSISINVKLFEKKTSSFSS